MPKSNVALAETQEETFTEAGDAGETFTPSDDSPAPAAEVKIEGRTFRIPLPYSEGQTLGANEAKVLNQTYQGNIAANQSRKVAAAIAAGKSDAEIQADLDAYVAEYKLGARQQGGREMDPVRLEAIHIATESLKKAIRKKGGKVADYSSKELREAAVRQVESNPIFLEVARKRHEEASALDVSI